MIHNDICSLVGNTPIFRLSRLSEELGAEILVKAEHLNPGGSIKDRIAVEMVRAAEQDGLLSPGQTLVESTAGNTGIGLAWVARALGYRFVSVMTEADRGPKTWFMESMGSEVVLVPKGVAWDADDGPLGVARRIARERDGVFLNQFDNLANPRAHEATAQEILDALGSNLDALVVGIGTGGTVTGLGRVLKPAIPGLRMIGVAADGSYLGSEREGDRIAGITPDFPPAIFEPEWLDEIVPITAPDGWRAARRLAEVEGLPAGHSSGALLLAAEAEARRRPGSTILFFLCDTLRNYSELRRDAADFAAAS